MDIMHTHHPHHTHMHRRNINYSPQEAHLPPTPVPRKPHKTHTIPFGRENCEHSTHLELRYTLTDSAHLWKTHNHFKCQNTCQVQAMQKRHRPHTESHTHTQTHTEHTHTHMRPPNTHTQFGFLLGWLVSACLSRASSSPSPG